MKPTPSKIDAMKNAVCPKDIKSSQSVSGLSNSLKRFLSNYSTRTYPFRTLTKNDSDFLIFNSTKVCEKVIYTLEKHLDSGSCI